MNFRCISHTRGKSSEGGPFATPTVRAADNFEAGALEVVVDFFFSGAQVAEFLDRTYNAKDRFRKVAYEYN